MAENDHTLATYAHDFESTIQKYVANDAQLIGILNFSALWHEAVYLNDISLGDNARLIRSFLDPASQRLYLTVMEFIRNGVLRCHMRDKIVIDGKVWSERPSLDDVFQHWHGHLGDDRIQTQIFGEDRRRFNWAVDSSLKESPNAIVWYDPNIVKPKFRNSIRSLLNDNNSGLHRLLSKLPIEVEKSYMNVCEKNEYFTNADLWRLYRDRPDASELVVAHGHINQQCCAEAVGAGITGNRVSPLDLQDFDWSIHMGEEFKVSIEPPRTFEDVIERADFVLDALPLETLGLLTPQQVMKIREKAEKTIFRIARGAASELGLEKIPDGSFGLTTILKQLPIDRIARDYRNALKEYWAHICEFVEQEFPLASKKRRRGRLAAIPIEKLGSIPAPLRVVATTLTLLGGAHWLQGATALPWWEGAAASGTSNFIDFCVGRFGYHIFLERTPAMQQLRSLSPDVAWRPDGACITNRWK